MSLERDFLFLSASGALTYRSHDIRGQSTCRCLSRKKPTEHHIDNDLYGSTNIYVYKSGSNSCFKSAQKAYRKFI